MKRKLLCSFILIAMLASTLPMQTLAVENNVDAPSELFIDLYSNVFLLTDSYEVYDGNGNCITDDFISEYYENYVTSDFKTIWDGVAENGYLLKYREQNDIQPLYETESIASEWTYVLASLDNLVNGKRVEFAYRVIGTYNISGGKIISYNTPTLDFTITDPGDLFTYTKSITPSATLNSARTQITFNISFTMTFCYPYSAAVYQTIGPYTASVVGYA